MKKTKWGPRASTVAKYEEAMKRANILIESTGKCDWLPLTASYHINNSLSSVLQQLQIIERHGKKPNYTYKWVGKAPDKEMARKVLIHANKRIEKMKAKKPVTKEILPKKPKKLNGHTVIKRQKEINILWGLVKISF